MAHRLYREKNGLERHLSNRTNDLFSLDDRIIIYDLTNTYFEGGMKGSRLAKFGRSKEKRNDAKQVVLAAVVNKEGFLKESQIFQGNMSDPESLRSILDKLKSHRGNHAGKQVVVIDAGISTKNNLEMLKSESFHYICVSRSKLKNYRITNFFPVEIKDKSDQPIEIRQMEVDDCLFHPNGYRFPPGDLPDLIVKVFAPLCPDIKVCAVGFNNIVLLFRRQLSCLHQQFNHQPVHCI